MMLLKGITEEANSLPYSGTELLGEKIKITDLGFKSKACLNILVWPGHFMRN